MDKLRIVEWFGGIGAATQAIKRLGIEYELVDYVELDKHAVKSFNLLNDTNFEPKDINDINVNEHGGVDILIAGWPCQDLSIAGKQKGLMNSERSSLIWTTIKKIGDMVNKPKVILLENVKGLLNDKHSEVFEIIKGLFRNMGYFWSHKLLNAKYFGVPQNRERVYCVLTRDKEFEWDWSEKFDSVKVNIREILDEEAEWMVAESFVELGKYGYINATERQLELKSSYKRYWNVEDDYIGAATASVPPKIYFKNQLSQYRDRLVEVDLDKLHNQDNQEINRVGQLGNVNEKGEFETIAFKQDKNFQGENGVSTTLVATSPQSKCKIMRFEPLSFSQKRHFQGVDGVSKTLRAGDCDKEAKILKEEEFQIFYRNLTSSECWKLMGFSSEYFDKVKGHVSNNQLCKQAGNSIVVNVLVEIFFELLKENK